jgi:hypothetical protein
MRWHDLDFSVAGYAHVASTFGFHILRVISSSCVLFVPWIYSAEYPHSLLHIHSLRILQTLSARWDQRNISMKVQFFFFSPALNRRKEDAVCIEKKVLRRKFFALETGSNRRIKTAVYCLYCSTECSTEVGQLGKVTGKVMSSIRNIKQRP